MMKRLTVTAALAAMFFISPPGPMAGEEDFARHRDRHVADLQKKIECLKSATDWEEWEACHKAAERREKVRRLEELKEEQRRLQEELDRSE